MQLHSAEALPGAHFSEFRPQHCILHFQADERLRFALRLGLVIAVCLS